MQHQTHKFDESGRLDKLLAHASGLSRSYVQKLIKQGHVWQGEHEISEADYQLHAGDDISWTVPEASTLDLQPEAIGLDILYQDKDLLVVNKAAFMCVHPAPGQWQGTLVNALLHHCGDELSGIGGVARPGIVHRLDKDTSGILVVAKNDHAHHHLSAQFASHDIARHYIAFCKKTPDTKQARIEGYIGRHPKDRKKMHLFNEAQKHKGRWAAMDYQLQASYNCLAAKIKCTLHTGRTHQIRVQMSAIGLPLIGDPVYGGRQEIANITLNRQALHAYHLGFKHPQDERLMEFSTALPEDLLALEQQLLAS